MAPTAQITAKRARPHQMRAPFSLRSPKVMTLLSQKLPKMATIVAQSWALAKGRPTAFSATSNAAMCSTMPIEPTPANSTKRTGIQWPTVLSTSSNAKSRMTPESSLLSPATRVRNWNGSSMMRGGVGIEAMMSSRILKPMAERLRSAVSNVARLSMKKPLIGSATSVFSTIWPSLVARLDMPARFLSHSPMPPPGT